MGPLQHVESAAFHQVPAACAPVWRSCRCLLQGCERLFHPRHPRSRYCSVGCQAAARRWSRWRAGGRYRKTERGRQCRREQSRRFRERCRQRQRSAVVATAQREGHHKQPGHEFFCCDRPGCYVLFRRTARSPCQKFCGPLCRMALRRVLVGEARWRRLKRPPSRHRGVGSPRAP